MYITANNIPSRKVIKGIDMVRGTFSSGSIHNLAMFGIDPFGNLEILVPSFNNDTDGHLYYAPLAGLHEHLTPQDLSRILTCFALGGPISRTELADIPIRGTWGISYEIAHLLHFAAGLTTPEAILFIHNALDSIDWLTKKPVQLVDHVSRYVYIQLTSSQDSSITPFYSFIFNVCHAGDIEFQTSVAQWGDTFGNESFVPKKTIFENELTIEHVQDDALTAFDPQNIPNQLFGGNRAAMRLFARYTGKVLGDIQIVENEELVLEFTDGTALKFSENEHPFVEVRGANPEEPITNFIGSTLRCADISLCPDQPKTSVITITTTQGRFKVLFLSEEEITDNRYAVKLTESIQENSS